MSDQVTENPKQKTSSSWDGFIQAAGVILAISYPVLALSAGARAVYRLTLKEGVVDYLPPAMSLVAAICYLVATLGIVYRKKWGANAWWLSVGVLGFETLCTLVIGTLSLIEPDLIGRTVWRAYGADYGYFPLFQPLLGLAWLFNKDVRRSYGFKI
ncbi:MAG: hypothetical protein AAF902_00495 [Chloroflexota bacterium]